MGLEQEFPIDRLQVEGLKELHETEIKGEGALEGNGFIIDGGVIRLDLAELTKTNIAKGVEAYDWGKHYEQGYLKIDALVGYATESFVTGAIASIPPTDLSAYVKTEDADEAYAPKFGYPDWAFYFLDNLNF